MSRGAGSAGVAIPDSPSSSIIKKAEWIHCMRLFRDKYKEVTRNRFENDSTHVTQLKVVLLSSAECVLMEVIRKTRNESNERYSLEELLVLNKHLGKAVEALNAAPKKAKYNSGSLTSRNTSKFHPKSDRSLRSIFTPSSKDYSAPVSSSLASDASSSLSSSITLSLEASSSFLSSSFSSSSSSSSSLLNDDQLSDSSSSSSSKEETRRRNKGYESREEENETTEEESEDKGEGGLLTARQVYSSPFALTSAESKLCQAREEMEMYLNLLESRIGLLQRILNSSDSLTVVMANSQKWYIVGKYLHKIRVSGLLEQAPNTILALENTTELPLPHGISLLQGEKVLCEQPGVRTRTLTPFSMRPILAGCTLFITNWRVIFYFDEPHIEYSYFPVHCIQSMDKHGGRNHGGSGLEDYRIDLYLKDLRIFRLCFDKDTAVYEGGLPPRRMVFTTLLRCLQTPITLFFAFRYRPIHSVELSPRYLSSSSSPAPSASRLSAPSQLQEDGWNIYNPWAEYRRLGVGVDEEEIGGGSSKWKITAINQDYSLCSSYPAVFVVPDGISHSALFAVAKFRSRGRIPILSWKHPATQASIVRCSQPKTGVSRNSCPEDQNLLQAILKATPNATRLHILDARPKANAMANTAMGAGYELAGDYANCSLSFLGIGNIHVMRDSLRRVRDLAETYGGTAAGYDVGLSMMNSRDDLSLLASDETSGTSSVSTFRTHSSKHQHQDQEDYNMKKNTSSRFLRMVNSTSSDGNGNNNKSKRKQKNSNKDNNTLDSSSFPSSSSVSSDNSSDNNTDKWFSALDATQWLHHVKLLLQSAVRAALLVHRLGEPVVVHCSDGWDRTSQLVSLAQLLLDPYYRTIVGFEVLVEKEWLRAGHQFALRLGHDGHFAHKTSKKKTGGRGKKGEKKQKEQQHNNLAKQRSPIFLQFLDCVWQLMGQFPLAFEFNENFLVELMDGMFGCKYGTFLFNTEQERKEVDLANNTESLWTYLNTHLDSLNLRNYFYEANKNFSPTTCSVDLLLPNCSFRKLRLWQSYYFRGVEGSSLLLNFNFETFAGELLRRKDEEIARLKAALLQQTRGGDKEEEKAEEEGGKEGEKEKEKGKEAKKKRESSWLTYKIFMQDRMLEEAKKQERKTEEQQNIVEEKKEIQMDKKKEAEDTNKRKELVEDEEEQEEDSSSLGETTTDFTTEEQTEESAFSSGSSSSSAEEESDGDKTDESEKEEEEEQEEEQEEEAQEEVKEILTSSWKSYKVNKQQPQRPETQRLMSPRGEQQQQQQQPKAKEKEKPKEKEKGGKKKEPDESEAEEGRKLQREETAATKQPAGAVRKWFFLGKKQQT